MTDDPERHSSWTLAAIKKHGLALEGYCETPGCGRFYVFNLDGLIEGFGLDYRVPEYLPIACLECGGRLKIMLAMVPPEE